LLVYFDVWILKHCSEKNPIGFSIPPKGFIAHTHTHTHTHTHNEYPSRKTVSLEKISVLGTLVISALRRLRQEDPEFKFNLGFIVSSSKAILGYSDSCQKKKKEGRKEGRERGRKGERRERERKEGRKKKKERKKRKLSVCNRE
jgi:predicted transposase YdaD